MATRIFYVITKANWGGAQRYVYDLATAAQDAGGEVTVAYGDEGELAQRLRKRGIRTEHISGLTRDIGIGRDIRSFFQLIRLFRQERPGVVHINSSKASGLGALAARLAGVPNIISTAHGWAFNEDRPWWQKMIVYKLAWLTMLLSHRTICVSNAVLRDVAWMPFVRSKCIVIYNGVPCDDMLTREAARAALVPHTVARYWIGMLSELHPTKHVDDALRAFAAIAERHPEAALVIISDGELRFELEQLILDLHMGRRIILLGTIADARRYLCAFDLFVHASISEAFGYAILEAGCAKLPVVATRVGGIPEIIPDDDHGLLVPPRNPEALAGAIESLMRDPHRAAELGAHLHARIQNSFSKQKMITETLELYGN
ncbi:hypothetical protein A3E99_01530 [Candidatus Kaiserbacteria bacterium RIFCSPHIGHO2_12_FULL_54_16]|nr:MAG: hypothetical protein A3E99_01530 [Candidatus Kaiserbacteria bacterium RIFCSPHIGHO2_12_FULL_54_16]